MLDTTQLQQLAELHKTIVGGCSKCHGSGAPCECHDSYRKYWSYIDANIKPKYWHLGLTNLVEEGVQKPKEKVEAYLSDLENNMKIGKGLFMCGKTGTGKTTLGCIVLKQALAIGKSCHFITFTDCIALEKEGWKDDEKKEFFQDKLLGVDVLLLDELGAEFQTEKSMEFIQAMFNGWFRKRCDSFKTTIITSNIDKRHVEEKYGSRIMSILAEHMYIIPFTSDEDYRRDIIAPQNAEKLS